MDSLLIFPHQLFETNVALARGKSVFLVEDALLFRQYAFHKQKLVLHRAAMRMHADYLHDAGIRVQYIESANAHAMAEVIDEIAKIASGKLYFIDPVDDWLERRLVKEARRVGLVLRKQESPMFLLSSLEVEDQFHGGRMFMATFYAQQRKRMNILMEGDRPVGGQWSFDAQNRKRLPKGFVPPSLWTPVRSQYVIEAIQYVNQHFKTNPGDAEEFKYPVTYADARTWLHDFLEHRLENFGAYEDAISTRDAALFHSVLTPMLNCGLLSPREILESVLARDQVPLNSLEGFVRQIIGWREYMRAAYVLKGRQQRTRNFWQHTRRLPRAYWDASTNIEPIDVVIRRVLKNAYAHHIERLMLLANFMQLSEIHPDEVYRWFMEMFIDAYDWVMVPNVYGMGLNADGGVISTKPYISGSNYVRKMSDFKPGQWSEVWDALFWSFVAKHRRTLAANPRVGPIVRNLDRMSDEVRAAHLGRADRYLNSLA